MSDHFSLRLALVAPPAAATYTGLDYWLRMEQLTGDDRAKPAEMAEVIDELYGIEACSPAPTPEEEKPAITWDRLMEIAKRRLDIEECRRRASGDYTARVKVVYSHPNDPDNRPKLMVTVGTIISQVRTEEKISLTLSVREQKSLTLDYPVLHAPGQEWPGTAKWIGSVFNEESGAIKPPEIIGTGNVLAWDTTATGTLLIKFPTVYDLAEIEIPGIPKVGSLKGDTQPTTLRAFYHYQVFELEVDAINQDTTADGQTLAKLCGWDSFAGDDDGDGGQGSDSTADDDEDDGEEDDRPPTGCLEPDKELASEEYYRAMCCAPPPGDRPLPDCLVYAVARPTRDLDADTKKELEEGHRGKVSFIAVGPGPEGCGRQFRRQVVRRRNCCDDLEIDLTWDTLHSENLVSRGSVMRVYAYGGMRPTIAVRVIGTGFWLDAAYKIKQTAIQVTHTDIAILVFADSSACGHGQLDISDGCTTISWYFQATAGQWVAIDPWDCEYRNVAANWADSPRYSYQQGAYCFFWFQDSRYKITQRYWIGGNATGGDYGYSNVSFEAACSACPPVDWKNLIPAALADPRRYLVWERFPRLIDLDNCVHLAPYFQYFHGDDLSPTYGNVIEYSQGCFGGELLKTWSSSYPYYRCFSAKAVSLGTGWDWGTAVNEDEAQAFVWEWLC